MSLSRNLSGCQVFHPSQLPTDWDCVPLKDRLELLYGRALKEEVREPGDVDVFGSNGKVGSHNERWLDAPGILVGRKGTVGAVHYSERPFWPIDTTYYVRPTGKDNLRYLFYLLDHLPLKILNAATGVPGLSRRDAYALLGAFPPPDEQVAIAHVLNAVGAAIDRAVGAAAQATEIKRALAQELFSKGTRRELQKKSPVGLIPRSWDVKPVNAVVTNFEYGLSLPMHLKGATPILRMGNIQQGDVVMEELKYVTLSKALLDRYLLQRGDVLFNRTNSQDLVGKIGIYRLDTPAVFASYLIRLHANAALLDNYYLGQLLNSYDAQCRIKRFATPGVQQVNINAKNLGKVLIPVPGGPARLDEQREIAAMLEAADKKRRAHKPVIAALRQLKKSLMHDLLTGAVRVNAAQFPSEAAA
jgi:type I restriction enzyme, S subunit